MLAGSGSVQLDGNISINVSATISSIMNSSQSVLVRIMILFGKVHLVPAQLGSSDYMVGNRHVIYIVTTSRKPQMIMFRESNNF